MGKKVKDIKWISFFSQTGSEIIDLSIKLGFSPDIVITNKADIENLEIYKLYKFKIYKLSKNPKVEEYLDLFCKLQIEQNKSIITLHGYLKIIPKKLVENYNIFNLHPGLINLYPQLKGIHPQKKAMKLKHPIIGCVIHKVTEKVDDGEILLFNSEKKQLNEKDTFYVLKKLSLELWLDFFKKNVFKIK